MSKLVFGANASPSVIFHVYPTFTISLVGVPNFAAQTMTMMGEHPELPGGESLSSVSPSVVSHATAVSPYHISEWERAMYYNGISYDHPNLLYRSDLAENPIPISIPKGRHRHPPTKTIYGVFNTPLNTVWDTVASQIRDLLKARTIRYSAIQTARFLTHDEDGKDTLGLIVIRIATHPNTTAAENAHDASQDILALLEDSGVKGVVVEWYEGVVLSGLPLLRVTGKIDPTHHVRRFLTAVLGMPIAAAEREAAGAQGSVALFFHENKDNDGNPSAKVFAVTNCHVLREDTTTTYEFRGAGAPRQHVRLARFGRFQRGLDEIKDCVSGCEIDTDLLAREIVQLEAKPESDDQEVVAENKAEVEAKRNKLPNFKKDICVLEAFYDEVKSRWGDITCRTIGHVRWAPNISISVDVQGRNVIDLGAKFSPWQLTNMFCPQSGGGGRTMFEFPINGLLRINGWVPRELLAHPDCFDIYGEPCLIVMKDGNTTDLTVGRFAGLEAYLCDEHGVESVELAIYNYDRNSGPFSAKGDSGSLIFDGEGHMVSILHSGMGKDGSNHVTYATPAW
ncbi:hypothetical protein BKA82DRAFT_30979 [Pisolithus tinctorius]|uniref:Uncharacterized protein n=1 Tax=Pisolithus tinctorius Marx 270 TaxID=870435 RepID=A0A0C3NTU4_PISTI|nr:hypothetical protein BKA82DRAFT_30979 [Pisolithus tinctorius]KIN98830.1 hypothetical protein M404DRAFT_30979 [Pisolithus tinctorius Marx 270]